MKLLKGTKGLSRMMERFSSKQLLMISGGVALLAAVFVGIILSGLTKDTEKADKVQMVTVVVAKEDIPQRAIIKDEMVKIMSVPADMMPAGAAHDAGSVVGRPASVAIMQGDVLTDKKVMSDVRMAGFAGAIPADCRAVSIGINDITGIAGFAKAGDYVDVMLISDKKDKNTISGEIILQNVLLLAVNKTPEVNKTQAGNNSDDKDKTKDKDKNDGNASMAAAKDTPATATLALRPEEALRLAVAAQEGTVYLMLRPFKPNNAFTMDTEFFVMKNGDSAAAPQSAAPAAVTAPAPAYSAPAPSYAPAPAASAPAPAAPASVPSYSMDSIQVFRGTASTMEGVK